MKFALEGKEYEYDGQLLAKDARLLYDKAKVGLAELDYHLAVGIPDTVVAWMFVLKRRAGEAVKWEDTDNWDLATYKPVQDEKPSDGESGDGSAEADPTDLTTGKTRKRGITNT